MRGRKDEVSWGVERSRRRRKLGSTYLVVGHDYKIGLVHADTPIPQRLDHEMISHEGQRALVQVPARRARQVIVDRLGQINDMGGGEVVQRRSERSSSTREDEALPRDRFDSFGEGGRRGWRVGVVEGFAHRVSNGREGAIGELVSASIASALARLGGHADEGRRAVDVTCREVLGRPFVRGTAVGGAERIGSRGGEEALQLDELVVLGAEVGAALDGESRFGEGGSTVLGGVGDLGGEDGC